MGLTNLFLNSLSVPSSCGLFSLAELCTTAIWFVLPVGDGIVLLHARLDYGRHFHDVLARNLHGGPLFFLAAAALRRRTLDSILRETVTGNRWVEEIGEGALGTFDVTTTSRT